MTRERPRLIVRKRVDDTETPVSAMLKLGPSRPGLVLFESVTGGENRGRYSFVGLEPDLWWRVKDGRAETSLTPDFAEVIETSDEPMASMRAFIASCEVDSLGGLPPMAAGAFGYVGYDMVRYMERLPAPAPDPAGVPEAMLMRPTVVLIFDGVRQEIILAAPERGGEAATQARLDAVEAVLESAPPASRPTDAAPEPLAFASNMDTSRLR